MPMALESFDLRGYDLVVSSESGPAKGVIAPSTARHVCYCHTPMRYLWDLYPAYRNEWTRSRFKRALMAPLANYLRLWDYASSARVDEFVANSENVRRRIWKTYRRESQVIWPPVAVETFYWKPPEDYYLIVSELVAYKRVDSAIRVCAATGRKLRVVGDGPEYKALRRIANANVEFCGKASAEELRDLYARSRAFLMPAEEDFGITAVEALASGKPVIALARGGALETVPGSWADCFSERPRMKRCERPSSVGSKWRPPLSREVLQAYAAKFSEAEFARKMRPVLFPATRP